MQARHLIHYVPQPVHAPGLNLPAGIAALLYLDRGSDVYGWFAQARGAHYSAAFFTIENFYAERTPLVCRSMEDDVHGLWERQLPPPVQEIRSPVPEALGHELERLQSAFVDEWLFFLVDPHSLSEVEHYRRAGLPLHAFNIRVRRLGKLSADGAARPSFSLPSHQQLSHQSVGTDPNIYDLLRKCWRFDHPAVVPVPQILSAARGSAL